MLYVNDLSDEEGYFKDQHSFDKILKKKLIGNVNTDL